MSVATMLQEDTESDAAPKAFGAQDFIAFDFGDDDDQANVSEQEQQQRQSGPSSRPDSAASSTKGKKRKLDDRMDDAQTRRQKQAAASRSTPWSVNVDWQRCKNGAEMLHREVMAFDQWLTPTPQEHDMRIMVIELIRRAIKSQWRDAEIFSFGSQETMLYLPQGDIDLVVVSDSMEYQRRETTLRNMAACLRRNNLATDVQVIARAKVPIVKFVCTYAKLRVDISVNQTNGLSAAKYVNSWLRKSPSVRPLVMTVKQLLVQRGMSEVFSGGLGSYSVIIMVISFLQLHPKVQRGEIDPARNLGVLLLEFLELYGKHFGYDNVGISIRGKGGYFSKARRGWKDERRPFMLCLEDPHDPTNDISKGSYNIIGIRSAFAGAFDIITAAICEKVKERETQGKHTKFGADEAARRQLLEEARAEIGEKDPNSLLGTILGVNKAMVKQRRDMEELYNSGQLQNRLGRPTPKMEPLQPEPNAPKAPKRKADAELDSAADASEEKKSKKKKKKDKKSAKNSALSSLAPSVSGGSPSDPITISSTPDPEPVPLSILDEDELASSQGFGLSSQSQNGARGYSLKGVARDAGTPDHEKDMITLDSDSEDDSRYTASKRQKRSHNKAATAATGRSSKAEMEMSAAELEDLAIFAPSTFIDDSSDDARSSILDDNVVLPTALNRDGSAVGSKAASAQNSRVPSAAGSRGPAPTEPRTKDSKKLTSRARRNFWAFKGVDPVASSPRDGSGVQAILE